MSTYTPCTGSGKTASNPRVPNVQDLGSRFAHMRGKTYGTCPDCGRSGLVLIRDHWLRNSPATLTPRHKRQEDSSF